MSSVIKQKTYDTKLSSPWLLMFLGAKATLRIELMSKVPSEGPF